MTEESFVRELERRADQAFDGAHGAPLTFESVRSKAHGIRRRRRAAAAGAVAAAVAVAILVPTVLTGGSPRSQGPDPAPAPPAAPGVSVLHDGVLTRPDGDTVSVDVANADVSQLGVLTDGRIVMALQQPYAVRVYAADGTVQATYPAGANIITMSALDDAVAWVAKDLTVRVLASGSAEPRTLPGIPMPGEAAGGIDAVLDAEHLLVGDHTTTTEVLTPGGTEPLTTSEPFRVIDVSPDGDLWAVTFIPTTDNEMYGCEGLYDPEAGRMVARSCDVSGLQFSPDGQHVLSLRGDNNMFGEGTILDLDLQPVGSFESTGKGDVISRAGWADATHVLVAEANWKTNTWSVVRVGLGWDDPQVVVPQGPGINPESAAYLFSG
ncbi:hypothetical protein [Nocardioides sp. T2.26MG-1]|uniref:hypothetical protein n=1 Tax=Nocardioides sp. T2.26MG-1 TaxID=3041166 RepID=UPI002477935E|nr:hypothetical protein [Nocardioides sp. T2.26MG-1]CAI9415641.1 hypothetical protein HIDPHFAB_02574 [Nocardioides sp. T2.26MG-1]